MFSLARHTGPYEAWPLKTPLLIHGAHTGISVPGYVLLAQFSTLEYHLLVTDYDCPFEERTEFILLDKDKTRVLDCRDIGGAYASFLFDGLDWTDPLHFSARISGLEGAFHFTLRSFGFSHVFHRLKMIYQEI
jgi:hypothetical protein